MPANGRRSAPWLALSVLALGLFMTLLDLTIVNVAIPSIVDDLRSSLDQILWVLNGYSLVYGSSPSPRRSVGWRRIRSS
ncbi:MAG: MFS transporter [Chloroflexi bacterium]|nr:MAG: MFS transporter [Chloroflexota bacterium]